MSKDTNNPLIQLIKSLTKAEKRYFKLLARRNSGKKDSMFIQLFDVIDKYKTYDEKLIIQKIPSLKKQQLANHKSNLYKQILAALRSFHRGNNIDIHLSEQLDFARVLYDKGMYKASVDILDKAKKQAFRHKHFMLAQNIVEFEKRIESQHITGSTSKKADELQRDSLYLISRNSMAANLSSLSLQLYGLYLKNGYVRNEKDHQKVENFFKKNLILYPLEEMDFFEKLFYFQSHVWYSNMTHNFLNYYKYAQKWVHLFHEHPDMLSKETPAYLKGLHNVLNALFLAGKYDKFLVSYNELIDFNKNGEISLNRNEKSSLLLFQYIHSINKHYMEGSFSQGIEKMPELISVIESNEYNWDKHRIMVFQYKIACLYFGAGYNEEAIHFLNQIINNYLPGVREDIQSFARILNLIAHYELGNQILIGYQLKSVFRFLSKMNNLHEVQNEIFRFIRKTPRIKRRDINTEFQKLINKLLEIQKSKYEKRPFLYLDIISWLESKIENVPVEEIIRKKFILEQKSLIPVQFA